VKALEKLIKIAVGAAIGWIISQVATDELESAGVPKEAATVVGGIIGAFF
jgi:hypothetical protein